MKHVSPSQIKKTGNQEKEFQDLNDLIQTILHCLLWGNKLSEDDADITRYNKSILNKIYDCLNKSIALLHGAMFVNIITNLLQQQQTNEKLQRKTLEIFNLRLRDESTPENEVKFERIISQGMSKLSDLDGPLLATDRLFVRCRW